MKPAAFEYHRAYAPDEVVTLLTELGDDAKILAGGQSLAPMMNFRLARPSALVDVNAVGGLDGIRRDGDTLRVGALTRHRALEVTTDDAVHSGFGLLPRSAPWIGHYPIRSRGTVGGSIAHADPTAEWCLMAALFDADVVLLGPSGERVVPVSEFFTGFLTTTATFDEFLTEVRFHRPRAHGALQEYTRRRGDFAVAAVGVAFDVTDGRLADVGIVLGGVASMPLRATAAEQIAEGRPVADVPWDDLVEAAADGLNPPADLHGDAAYRRRLVRTLTRRAFEESLAGAAS